MSKQRRPVVCGNVNWGTTRASLIAFLVAASLFVGGCSGDLSGDFYYTTRGGDVKRLVDREVALVRLATNSTPSGGKLLPAFRPLFRSRTSLRTRGHKRYKIES